MSVSPKVKVFLIMLVAIVLSAVGESIAAKGMKEIDNKAAFVEQVKAALTDWHVWVGFALLLGYLLLYIYSLALANLSVVLPLSAASYMIGIILSKYYLHEDIKPARWVGTFVIMAGVLIIAWSSMGEEAKE
jgi:drug/metabolite transporter (DMT)-like permease